MNINNLINEIKSNYNTDELVQIINELKLLLVKQKTIVETDCKCHIVIQWILLNMEKETNTNVIFVKNVKKHLLKKLIQ